MRRVSWIVLSLPLCGDPLSAAFTVDRAIVSAGGAGDAAGGEFSLSGTAGQVAAGVAGDECLEVRSGFWTSLLRDPDVPEGSEADLILTLRDEQDPVLVGGAARLHLQVRNGGPAGATGVVVAYPIPEGAELFTVASLRPYRLEGGILTWEVGSLGPDGCVDAWVTLRRSVPGRIASEARVTARQLDARAYDNVARQWTTVSAASPQAYSWTGAVGSQWHEPRNWTPEGVPGEADTAVVALANASIHAGAPVSVAELEFHGSSLTLAAGATIGVRFELGRGFLFGGTAPVRLGDGVEGLLATSGPATLGDMTLESGASVLWGGVHVLTGRTTTWRNLPGSRLELEGTASLTRFNAALQVINEGLLRKRTGDQTVEMNVENHGWMEVESGALRMTSTAVTRNTGHIEIGPGARLQFLNGGPPLNLGSSVHIGAGGAMVYSSPSSQAKLADGLRITGPGVFRMGETPSAYLNHEGRVEIDNAEIDGGTLKGAGTLVVRESLRWAGGMLEGVAVEIAPAALVTLEGTEGKQLREGILRNGGVARWSGTGPFTGSTAMWHNLPGSELLIEASGPVTRFNAPLTLVNEGVLRHVGSFQEAEINLDNRHRIEVHSGEWRMRSSSLINSGHIQVAEGARWRFWDSGRPLALGGTIGIEARGIFALRSVDENSQLLDGLRVTGDGVFQLGGSGDPWIRLGGRVEIERLEMLSGWIRGSGDLIIGRQFDWWGSGIDGNGTVVIQPGAHWNLLGDSASRLLEYRHVINRGTIHWRDDGVWYLGGGSVLTNEPGGTILLASNAPGRIPQLINRGTVRRAGSGTQSIDGRMENHGLVDLSSGVVEFRQGMLSGPRSTTRARIDGPQPGQLALRGNVQLDGLLQIVRPPAFEPALGQQFTLLSSANPVSGAFRAVVGRDAGAGRFFDMTGSAADITLVVSEGMPPPAPDLVEVRSSALRDGRLHLDLASFAGLEVIVQASDSLAGWQELMRQRLETGELIFIDDGAALASRRFYRALVQP